MPDALTPLEAADVAFAAAIAAGKTTSEAIDAALAAAVDALSDKACERVWNELDDSFFTDRFRAALKRALGVNDDRR